VVQEKEIPTQYVIDFKVSLGLTTNLPQVMMDAGLVKSKSEAMRLIMQGGVDIDGIRVTSPQVEVTSGCVLKVGKRKFLRLIT